MKTINETFTDEEFDDLRKLKKELSWRNFIILMSETYKETIKHGRTRKNNR